MANKLRVSNTFYGNIKRLSIGLSSIGVSHIPFSRSIYKKIEHHLVPKKPVYLKAIRSYMHLYIDDGSLGGGLLLNETIEPYTCSLISDRVKLGMTCVDIGANIGYISLLMASRLKGTGRLYCFEPDPYTFRQLESNMMLNNIRNATLSEYAVSDHNGKQTLYVDRSGRCLNSLYDHVGDHQITVDLVTLNDYFKNTKIDVLKIDAQGADGLIIKGGLDVLARYRPHLFIEFWPNGLNLAGTSPREVLEMLHSIGYTLYIVDDDREETRAATDKEILETSVTLNTDSEWYRFANIYAKPQAQVY